MSNHINEILFALTDAEVEFIVGGGVSGGPSRSRTGDAGYRSCAGYGAGKRREISTGHAQTQAATSSACSRARLDEPRGRATHDRGKGGDGVLLCGLRSTVAACRHIFAR